MTKAEVLQLVQEWHREGDPVASGQTYAEIMVVVIEQWAPFVPDATIVDEHRELSFAELAERNRAAGGCGCAPGTLLCPH